METAYQSMEVMKEMAENGLQNSLSDAGVGALCARTAVIGAYFNVRINAKDIKDKEYAMDILARAKEVHDKAVQLEQEIVAFIDTKI
jgi:glutamate formiminotransferase/formiminotetrahydrofolate cyclodeaminase